MPGLAPWIALTLTPLSAHLYHMPIEWRLFALVFSFIGDRYQVSPPMDESRIHLLSLPFFNNDSNHVRQLRRFISVALVIYLSVSPTPNFLGSARRSRWCTYYYGSSGRNCHLIQCTYFLSVFYDIYIVYTTTPIQQSPKSRTSYNKANK